MIRGVLCRKGAPRLWIIALLAGILWGTEYWQRDLWEPDEARYAYVSREMRQDGHWLVPHRHGEYYAHKPPLIFWLNNAFASFNGGEINRITTRLPTLAGTILSLWTTGQIAALLFGGAAGWMAPMVLAVSALFWNVNGMGQIDGLLGGLGMLAFWLLLSTPSPCGTGHLRMAGAYLAMGLAMLAKGPVGLLVPLGAWIAFSLLAGQRQRLRNGHLLWGLLIALLPVAIWLGAIVYFKAAPDGYLDELLFKQNVGRAAGTFRTGHLRPFWYFIPYFITDFLPWTLLLPAALLALKVDTTRRFETRGVLAWMLFVILFFSLSATKRNLYILMAYPAAAILLAGGWDRITSLSERCRLIFQRLLAGVFLLCGLGLTVTTPVVHLCRIGVPIETVWLVPVGGVLLLTGIMLWRPALTTVAKSNQWLAAAAAGLALALWLMALLVYPVLNPLKAPYALAEAATQYLPAGQDLLLYRINGEIQALYCHARGCRINTPGELAEAMRTQQSGMLVMPDNHWNDIGNIPGMADGMHGKYRMGGKTLIWVAFHPGRQAEPVGVPSK